MDAAAPSGRPRWPALVAGPSFALGVSHWVHLLSSSAISNPSAASWRWRLLRQLACAPAAPPASPPLSGPPHHPLLLPRPRHPPTGSWRRPRRRAPGAWQRTAQPPHRTPSDKTPRTAGKQMGIKGSGGMVMPAAACPGRCTWPGAGLTTTPAEISRATTQANAPAWLAALSSSSDSNAVPSPPACSITSICLASAAAFPPLPPCPGKTPCQRPQPHTKRP